MTQKITLKKGNTGLPVRTFNSSDGKNTYLVFKQIDGSYHAFVEVEAKDAAMSCGSELGKNKQTRSHWNKLWEQTT